MSAQSIASPSDSAAHVVGVPRLVRPLSDLFPFEYQGGGYFRSKGIPMGIAAEILHGQQAIEWLYAEMTKDSATGPNNG